MTSSESSFPPAEDRVHTLRAETNQLHITHTSQLVCQCCQATVQGVTRLQRLFWSCGQKTDVLRRRMAQTWFFFFYIELFVYYSSLFRALLIRLFFAIVVWVPWFPEEWLLLAGFCLASFTVAASALMPSWARSLRFVPCRVFASSAIIRQEMRHEGREGGGQTSTVTPQPAPTSTNHLECYPPVPVSWND